MSSGIQIFVGNNNLDLIDFYPDDLPNDWYFDYYSSRNNAVILHHSSDQDFEEILENIDDEFKLVIDVSDIDNFDAFIQPLNAHKEHFILYANTGNTSLIDSMQEYSFCIYTTKQIKDCKHYDDNYFNNYLVVIEQPPLDEQSIRRKIEQLATIQEDIVFIQKNSDIETLEKTRIIIDLLGFY